MYKKIGVSAYNIREGGPLTVLKIFLKEIQKKINKNHKVFIYLNNSNQINYKEFDKNNFKFFFLKKATNNYFYKLYYHYFFFKNETLKRKYDVWISLQDVIPDVKSKKKFSYFHSPIIFHKMSLKEIFFEPTSYLRSIFFKIHLRKNKHNGTTIITQQNWIKNILKKKYGLKKIIVSKPNIIFKTKKRIVSKKIIFLYPSLPRFQKNYEVICKACENLKNKRLNYQVLFTFNKNECRYAKYIYNISKKNPNIKFIGRKNYNQMKELYQKSNYLLFPSKLETWGLPLSEAISFNLPILASNLNYVRETVGNYKKIIYFEPDDYRILSDIIYKIVEKKIKFEKKIYRLKYLENSLSLPWKQII